MKYVPVGNIPGGVSAHHQGTAHCLPNNVPDIPGRALKILEASLAKVRTVKDGCPRPGKNLAIQKEVIMIENMSQKEEININMKNGENILKWYLVAVTTMSMIQ